MKSVPIYVLRNGDKSYLTLQPKSTDFIQYILYLEVHVSKRNSENQYEFGEATLDCRSYTSEVAHLYTPIRIYSRYKGMKSLAVIVLYYLEKLFSTGSTPSEEHEYIDVDVDADLPDGEYFSLSYHIEKEHPPKWVLSGVTRI